MIGVLACGVAVLDVQQSVDRLPEPNEKMVAEDLLIAAGGPAANAAVTAAALGAAAQLVTRIGDSPLGTFISADLASHAVRIIDHAGPGDRPAVSTVLVTRGTGQRAVVSVNASRREAHQHLPGDAQWPSEALVGAGALLVDGHHLDLALPLAAAARAGGVPVLLDGGSWKPGLERLLPLVDIAVLSAAFSVPDAVSGSARADVLAAVRRLGPDVVARSDGPRPIVVVAGSSRRSIPVPRVDVIDTLGAGDVLHGALLAWLAAHGCGDLTQGLAWAAHVAADSCTAAGAHGWHGDAPRLARHRAALSRGPVPTTQQGRPAAY